MKKENKDLLLKDISARLPYGVKIKTKDDDEPYSLLAIYPNKDIAVIGLQFDDVYATSKIKIDEVKPYIRPMSSMTDEEVKEFYEVECIDAKVGYIKPTGNWHFTINGIDWLNAHHFDYRGLIEKGLAIEVTESNNPYEKDNN